MSKKVFLAGASGVIGVPLCKLLVKAGFEVYGTTRSQAKAEMLETLGVKPVVVDAFDPEGLEKAMCEIQPEILLHQLTDLPDGLKAEEMEAALVRNARIRDEGTRNLVRAAELAGVKKVVAQSIGFVYAPSDKAHTEESPLLDFNEPPYGETARAVHSLEQQVLNGNFVGIVLRNGWFYGADSGIENPVDFAPALHVEAAAQAVLLAMNSETSGIYNVSDADPRLDTSKFRTSFPEWSEDFRL